MEARPQLFERHQRVLTLYEEKGWLPAPTLAAGGSGPSPNAEYVRQAGVSSTGGCNSVLEFSGWGHEAEGLTGAGVQFQGDAVQVLLAVR